MAKLPPRVVGKKKNLSEKASVRRPRESDDESQVPLERTEAARKFGIGMMLFGAIVTVLPLFGLQLRSLGDHGFLTPVIGIILLIIGGISFIAGQSRILANVLTMGSKIVMWGIIAFGLLILVGGAIIIGIIAMH